MSLGRTNASNQKHPESRGRDTEAMEGLNLPTGPDRYTDRPSQCPPDQPQRIVVEPTTVVDLTGQLLNFSPSRKTAEARSAHERNGITGGAGTRHRHSSKE